MKPALPLLLTSALLICGCDQISLPGSSSSSTTDTNMRSVEIQEGTASDEMITLDTASGDGTAIDPSSATGPAPPRPAAAADGEETGTERRSDSGTAAARDGDQVIRPPAGGAEPDSPDEETKN